MENIRIPIAKRSPFKLNINRATYHQLILLPGISDIVAARILLYRQNQGDFNSLAEIPAAVDRSVAWLDGIRHRLEV
jgi:DNA uptake protein ComE-like DNA-binding protein